MRVIDQDSGWCAEVPEAAGAAGAAGVRKHAMRADMMTVSQRLARIRAVAVQAKAAHERAGVAQGFPAEDMHWDAYEAACAALIGLIACPEGEAMLGRLALLTAAEDVR